MYSYNKRLSFFISNTNWLDGFNFINNLKFKIINNINCSFLKEIKSSKIVIFGRGSYYDKRLKILEKNNIKLDIAYYLDNDSKKVSLFENTHYPDNININSYPILIASSFSQEINRQLTDMNAKKIYFMEDLFLQDYGKNLSFILLNYIVYFQMPIFFSKMLLYIFNSYDFINELDLYKHTNLNQDNILFKNISQFAQLQSKRKYIMPLLIYLQNATKIEVENFLRRKDILIKLDYPFFALLSNGLINVITPNELCLIIKQNSNNFLYTNSDKLKLFLYISLICRVYNLDTLKYFSLNQLSQISVLPIDDKGLYTSILLNLIAQDKTKQKLHTYIINRLFKCSMTYTTISKKVKVALCISGQLRGYIEAFDTVKRFIINNKDIEVDVYIHSWKNIGARQLSAINIERISSAMNFNKVFKEISYGFSEKELHNKYFSLNNLICNQQLITEKELELFYNTTNVVLDDENEDSFNQMTNSEKMYFKMYAVNQLVKESKKKYDIVIRTRPDIKIDKMFSLNWNKIAEMCNRRNIVFGDTYSYTLDFSLFAMSEAFIIGSQRNMDIYTSTWENMYYFQKYKMPGNRFQAHEAGAFRLWISNVKMEILKGFVFSACNQKKLTILDIKSALLEQLERSTNIYDQLLLNAIQKDLENA